MAHHAANLVAWWVFALKSYGPVGHKAGGFRILQMLQQNSYEQADAGQCRGGIKLSSFHGL